MGDPIAIHKRPPITKRKEKNLYWTNKLQEQSARTSVLKNQKGIIEIKQAEKKEDDNNIFGNWRKNIVDNIMDSNILPLENIAKSVAPLRLIGWPYMH